MATGTPDYFRTVRETYGAAKNESGDEAAIANSTKTLVNISGKGIIYGGQVGIYSDGLQLTDVCEIWIDGQKITYLTMNQLRYYNVTKENQQAAYLIVFDNQYKVYAVGISKGITYEETFVVKYTEASGRTPNLKWSVIYALL